MRQVRKWSGEKFLKVSESWRMLFWSKVWEKDKNPLINPTFVDQGNFIFITVNSGNFDRNVRGNYEVGHFVFQITRSPKLGRPRNSPANMHVRRKLPLSKFDDDDDQVSALFWRLGRTALVV